LTGIFGYLSFYYTAFKYAPALHVNSLNYLWPILTAIIAQLFFKELQFSKASLFWLLVAFIGTFGILTSVKSGAEHFYPNIILGYGLAITAAIIWAVYNNITRTIHCKVENMAGIFFAIAVLSFFLHHILESSLSPNQTQWIGIIGLSVVNLGYAAWDYALKDIKLNFILGIAYFIPIFSTLILLHYNNTGFSFQFTLSSSLIFIAAYIMNRSALK
jgi:drug/metabolite transporter (DMT)-like permease